MGTYMDIVAATAPTYFWSMQGDTWRPGFDGEVNISDAYAPAHGDRWLFRNASYQGGTAYWPGPYGHTAAVGTSSFFLYDARLVSGSVSDYTINANENTTAYSYGGWFRHKPPLDELNSYANRTLMGNWDTNGSMLHVGDNSTGLNDDFSVYHENNAHQFDPPSTYTRGDWFHVIVTWNGTTQRVYWNGVEHTSIARSGALGASAAFNVGTYNNRSESASFIAAAYVGWWVNKALSAAEVQALYLGVQSMTPSSSQMRFASDTFEIPTKRPTVGMGITSTTKNMGTLVQSAPTIEAFAERIAHQYRTTTDQPIEGSNFTLAGNPCGQWGFSRLGGDVIANSALMFTSDQDQEAAFVVVDGNLTVPTGVTLTPPVRKLFTCIYVTGDLIVNGTISMTARGANHGSTGSNIAAFELPINATLTIPAVGGAAGLATTSTQEDGPGRPGTNGTDGRSGGGGSGALYYHTAQDLPNGTPGTCFTGGTGGSGPGNNNTTSYAYGVRPGSPNGGAGGPNFYGASGQTGTGAGNPSGGTGGTLIVICKGTISGSGSIVSAGSPGYPGSVGSGGGTGGGSVTVVCARNEGPTPTAPGGAGGTSQNRVGGKGGDGSVRLIEYVHPTVKREHPRLYFPLRDYEDSQSLGSIPVGVSGSASAVDSLDRVWVVGGQTTGLTGSATTAVQRWNDVWAAAGTFPALPVALTDLQAGVDDQDRLHVFGGDRNLGGFVGDDWRAEAYVLDGGVWESLTPMPKPMVRGGCARDSGGLLHVVSGNTWDSSSSEFSYGHFIYDPVLDTWDEAGALDLPWYPAIAIDGQDRIYAIAGYQSALQSQNLRYDPISDTWETLTPLPVAVTGGHAVAYGKYVSFLGGGEYATATRYAHHFRYDSELDTWTQLPDLPRTMSHGVAQILSDYEILVGVGRTTTLFTDPSTYLIS